MMKQILLILSLFTLLLITVTAQAQDARFSQYYNQPLNFNSALAGNGIEHIRISAIYRNQWTGMGTPFTTQGLSVDKVVNRVGIGATISRNGAGDASIKTLNILGNLAYHLPLGPEKNHTLSGGLQVGIVNKSFDPSKLTFDNQYNPDQGYDPSQNSGEIFSSTSVTRPDVNFGLMWQRGWLKKNIKFKPYLGIGVSHITRPSETFIAEESRANIKRSITGGAGITLSERTEIRPSFINLSQGSSNETVIGSMINFQLDNKNSVQVGVYNRMNDAVIAYAGYQMNLLFVGMSYDINTGELSKSGKGTNSFEISLAYSPRSRKKKNPADTFSEKENKTETMTAAIPVRLKKIPNSVEQQLAIRPQDPELLIVKTEKPVAPIAVTETSEPGITVVIVPEKQEAIVVADPVIEKTIPVTPLIDSSVAVTKPITKLETPTLNEIKETEEIKTEVLAIVKPETEKIIPAKNLTDSDKDGIPDDEDRCPYIRGNSASNGCPDSDGDGLVDMEDDCPLEAGPSTNKGCPDPNKPSIVSTQELVKKYDHILFATGSTKLTTDDIFDIIERAVDILYADKNTYVLLSGHTDSEGIDLFNMHLSDSRNAVVKAYLLKQGIEESRIQTVAYGETMPLKNNLFEETRKQNRRVELNILRK